MPLLPGVSDHVIRYSHNSGAAFFEAEAHHVIHVTAWLSAPCDRREQGGGCCSGYAHPRGNKRSLCPPGRPASAPFVMTALHILAALNDLNIEPRQGLLMPSDYLCMMTHAFENVVRLYDRDDAKSTLRPGRELDHCRRPTHAIGTD